MFGHQDNLLSLVDALSALRLLARIPTEGLSEQQLLQQSLDALVEYQELERCSIFVLKEQQLECGATGSVRSARRSGVDDPIGLRLAVSDGIMGKVCEVGQIQYCRHCQQAPEFQSAGQQWLFEGAGSLLSIPITADERLLGVLNISHHLPEFFETWHQHFLMLFATSLGRMLALHRLVGRLQDEVTAPGS